MKLRVYQQGGGLIYTPFIPEKAGVSTAKASKSGDEDDAKLDPLDKELLSLMKDENLLPSDIQAISNALIAFQRSTQHLSDTAGFGGTGAYRSVMPGMLQIMNMVSTAKFNKNQWDKAISEMQKHDAGAEVAMDSYGRMFVLDLDGKLSTVSPKDFNPEKYQPISNSQLLQIRERSAGMDGQLLNSMADLVGKQDVYKAINEIIKAYGTKENAQLLSKDAAVQNVLIDANSPEGIYKLSTKYPQADLQKAFKVLYDELPTNMQNLLKANAALFGESNPTEGAYKFIHSIIMNNINTNIDPSYDATASKAAGFSGGNEGKEALGQKNYLMEIGTLRGDRTRVALYPRSQKIQETGALDAPAVSFGQVIDRQNKAIDNMSVADMIKNGWAFAAGIPGDVTYGNKLMKPYELEALMFDNSSNLSAVMLPYKDDGGHIVPNFDLLAKFNELQKILDDNPGITKMEISEAAKKLQIDPNTYSIENNKIKIIDTMAFLTVSAYAGDDTIDLSKDEKRYLEKIDKEDGQHIKDFYNNMVRFGKLRPAKKENVELKGYSKSGKNDFWRGNIFIPMKNAYYSLLLSGIGEYIPKSQLTDYLERTMAREQEVALNKYAQMNDPNYESNKSIGQFNNE